MTTPVVLLVSFATFVIVVGVLAVIITQRRASSQAREHRAKPVTVTTVPEPEYVDPRTIKVGSTISVQSTRVRVIGALYMASQGDQWTQYSLDDGTRRHQWLLVRERGERTGQASRDLEIMLRTEVPIEGMVPARHTLIMEGMEFHPVGRGTVAFRSEGMTGFPDRGLLDFAGYQAGDGRLLFFQRFQGGQWAAAYAWPLTPSAIIAERRA